MDILWHVELGCALLVSAELHDKVLVASLTLTDRRTEAKLQRESDHQYLLVFDALTINRTCISSFGSRNSFEMVV